MKKIAILCMIFLGCISLKSQSTKTLNWGGLERQYLEYVPSNVLSPAPIIFLLHGLGDNMDNMFSATGFRQIADQHGWIIITPQAENANVSIFGGSYNLGPAWHSGVSGSIWGTNIVINQEVDDSGFLMELLDEVSHNYDIDTSMVFFTGFSMGGFMSNRMAMEHGDRITAIASVSGTIGNEIANNTPVSNISVMHIHGTADETVSYADASFSLDVGTGSPLIIPVGLGAEQTVDFWRNFNQCATTPIVTNYPDLVNDGLTFQNIEYNEGINGTKTVFIKVTNGDHDWYYTPQNDIDYATEIYNFFASFKEPTSIAENVEGSFTIYPNPTSSFLHVEGENINQIYIYDTSGRQLICSDQKVIDVSHLAEGIYFVHGIDKIGNQVSKKFLIAR